MRPMQSIILRILYTLYILNVHLIYVYIVQVQSLYYGADIVTGTAHVYVSCTAWGKQGYTPPTYYRRLWGKGHGSLYTTDSILLIGSVLLIYIYLFGVLCIVTVYVYAYYSLSCTDMYISFSIVHIHTYVYTGGPDGR